MKQQGHPDYQEVLFIDSSTGNEFVIGTTMKTKQTAMHDGKEYPVCKLSISSYSHPFYQAKKNQFVDAEGRVNKFQRRYIEAQQKVAKAQAKPEPETTKKKKK